MTYAVKGIRNINIASREMHGNGGANIGTVYKRVKTDDDIGKKFGTISMAMLAASGIREYDSKYSNRVYSNWQKISILVFITFARISLNSARSRLGMCGGFVKSIGLESIPDGSTLCKFQQRIPKEWAEMLFPVFAYAASDGCTLIADTTGLSNFNRSAHYEFRCDEFGKKLPKRTFTKLSTVIEKDTRLILSARSSVGCRHDITFMNEHLDDLERLDLKPSSFLADKGYDCENLHREIRNRLGCKAYIPVRRHNEKYGYTERGRNRREMLELEKNRETWIGKYGFRSVIESTNMMIKTQTDSYILETKGKTREIKALLKGLAHNMACLFRLGLDKWFIRGFQ